MTNDRVRAKKPNKDAEDWKSGVVEETVEKDYGYDIKMENGTVLSVTKAVYDLFKGRLDDGTPAGEKVWYKNKG